MCAFIKNELGFPLEAGREEDWGQIKKLGSNVLITFSWNAISETLNFVLEMSTLSFICFLFIFDITELVWIFKNFLIFLNCIQPVAKKGISNHPAKKTKTSFK